jgi:hypothetical protein
MCKCTPSIRTPYCGSIGCEWPSDEHASVIPFEKDEYNFYAAYLVFGQRNPIMLNLSAFSLEIFRKQRLDMSEMQTQQMTGSIGISRFLKLDNFRAFSTNNTDMRTEINRVVTYEDSLFRFNVSDTIFTDEEFEYFACDWNATVQNKIRTLGMLIKSIHERKIVDIPLLINEFPEITKALLDRSGFWELK